MYIKDEINEIIIIKWVSKIEFYVIVRENKLNKKKSEYNKKKGYINIELYFSL